MVVPKSEVAERLFFLNRYIKELIERRNECPDEVLRNNMGAEIKELYTLKNNTVIKMVLNGNASIRSVQKSRIMSYYVVRINRGCTFHLPITRKVKRIFNKNGKNGRNRK